MSSNVHDCYAIMRKMDGDEVYELLKMLSFSNLVSYLAIGMGIFHESFFEQFDKIKDMRMQ